MIPGHESKTKLSSRALHRLGVACGLAAGAWLGAAEAPTKLVTAGYSPFLISLGMVAGVFVARWTVPMALKGTSYILLDLREKVHLIIWAILAGMLWAVANTLTVFAIRNVGLSIAFPLWNTNSIVGLFWGWLLFNELRGAETRQWAKVLGGAGAIVAGACLLAYATSKAPAGAPRGTAALGILAALGAGLLWGTMYIPYRKAYISGMNPLSFVTVFTVGELGTVFTLAVLFDGGFHNVISELQRARPALFWLFLGGFCWVLGDLFQQYAAKYLGISRGIPLSNTNQLWGLLWGLFVFGELHGMAAGHYARVIGGSLLMAAGAGAIALASVTQNEHTHWRKAAEREGSRYGIADEFLNAGMTGRSDISPVSAPSRSWLDWLLVATASGIFIYLASVARTPQISFNWPALVLLSVALLASLLVAALVLFRTTRFQ